MFLTSAFVFISRVCVSHIVLIFNLQGLLGAFTSLSIPWWMAGGPKSNFISRLDLRWCSFTSLFCLLASTRNWSTTPSVRSMVASWQRQALFSKTCGIKTSMFGSFKCKLLHIAVLPSEDGRTFPHNLHKALCTWSSGISGPRMSSHVDMCQSPRGECQITCLAQKKASKFLMWACLCAAMSDSFFIGPGASSRKRTAADAEMMDQQKGTAIARYCNS